MSPKCSTEILWCLTSGLFGPTLRWYCSGIFYNFDGKSQNASTIFYSITCFNFYSPGHMESKRQLRHSFQLLMVFHFFQHVLQIKWISKQIKFLLGAQPIVVRQPLGAACVPHYIFPTFVTILHFSCQFSCSQL